MERLYFLVVLLVLLLSAGVATAKDFTFGWDHDGIDTTGYELAVGTATGGPYSTAVINIPGATVRTYTITGFDSTFTGPRYYFVLYAKNATQKSLPSGEVSWVKPTTTTTSVMPTTTTTSVKPTTTTTSIRPVTAPSNVTITETN